MVLLLDTATLLPKERNKTVTALMCKASGPTRVKHDIPDETIHNKIHYGDLGTCNGLIRPRLLLTFQPHRPATQSNDTGLYAVTYLHGGTATVVEAVAISALNSGTLAFAYIAPTHGIAFAGPSDSATFSSVEKTSV